jgi:hypothetical protein
MGLKRHNLSESIPESLTASEGESLTASPRANKRYAKLPASVLRDRRLTGTAKLVYAELALWAFQGNVVRKGQRAIAEAIGARQMTVSTAIRQLVDAGHIRNANRELSRRGQMSATQAKHCRGVYELLSPVFGSKQRDGITEVVSSPSGDRRFVSLGTERVG